MKRKKNNTARGERYQFELGRGHIIGLGCILSVIFLWMFILGVLTGRGVIFRKLGWWMGVDREMLEKANTEATSGGEDSNTKGKEVQLSPRDIEKELDFFHKVGLNGTVPENRKVRSNEKQKLRLPATHISKRSSVVKGPDKYFILVASFREKARADGVSRKLRKIGFASYVEKVDLREKGIWYRVCVGKYVNKKKARTAAEVIKKRFRVSPLVMVYSK